MLVFFYSTVSILGAAATTRRRPPPPCLAAVLPNSQQPEPEARAQGSRAAGDGDGEAAGLWRLAATWDDLTTWDLGRQGLGPPSTTCSPSMGRRGKSKTKGGQEGKQGKPNVYQQDSQPGAVARPRGPRVVPRGNPLFDEFYKAQGIVADEAEWQALLAAAYRPLPASFRIIDGRYASGLNDQLRADPWGIEGLQVKDTTSGGETFTVHAPQPVDWLPPGYAWSINAPRPIMRKCPALKSFHRWLVGENEQGSINRQELVSMIPPLLLGVQPGHTVLDMCAAPGSKTAQLVDMLHKGDPHPRDKGLVLANDSDTSRCYMLVHQLQRFAGDSIMVTNHLAQQFPTLRSGRRDQKSPGVQFDRVLCDVPCTGDGTMRKNPELWRRWNAGQVRSLHDDGAQHIAGFPSPPKAQAAAAVGWGGWLPCAWRL
jgi:16S rRNA C967 or C1407 C5-methylase (RsmB/RsmF family)